jgi:hypothetical protein
MRAATNHALFREVNERVRELNEGFSLVRSMDEWICECANDTCLERLTFSAEYEAVRRDQARFFVAPTDEHGSARPASGVPTKRRRPSMTVTEQAPIPTNPTEPVRLAFFYSPRSGKSRRADGYLAQVLQHRRNHDTFQLVRVDVDRRPDLATRFRVTETPTLIIIAGNRTRARVVNPTGCHQITRLLRAWLK